MSDHWVESYSCINKNGRSAGLISNPRAKAKKILGSQCESASVRKERCGGGKIKPLRRGGWVVHKNKSLS